MPRSPERIALLLAAAAVAIVWASALRGAFQFDDYAVIVDNPAVHSWSAFVASMPGIRPLLKASYTMNWLLEPQPFGFLSVNALVHLANTLLVFVLAKRWVARLGPPAANDDDVRRAALVAALIFALHPAQTEAVSYIAGRSVSLCALFFLGAMEAAERERDRDARGVASILLLVAAMLVRETAAILPVALVLTAGARDRAGFVAALRRTRWHFATVAIGVAAMLAVPTVRRLIAASFATRGPWDNLVAQVTGITYLVTTPLLRLHTSIDPDLQVVAGPDLMWAASLVMIVALVAAGIVNLARRPWLGVGILWFFVALIPTNSLLARLDVANDRQLYLALIGPALVIGVLVARTRWRRTSTIAATLLCATLALATIVRNADYRSEIALWETTVRASPEKARPWNNLGMAFLVAGRRDEAREAFEQALLRDPADYKARVNLDRARSPP